MFRLFFFLIGYGLAVIGGIHVIIHLNLIPIGYSLTEYILFIGSRPECIALPVGLLIIWASIFVNNKK
ncbi:hypothetical protein H1Z61_04660 [Bacillus aquiflavi]|uniref:Uncharacterized protein n=1 Tax=Bacillus aquiflavi TaxID=2672567 RepID=A0A6B3VV23_9BACI|nr:hypothetical protein [Bacillus aquiflavi]MBA4536454.1 hypothetical protein [Bacillus aquiflavi]NEY80822.1 hypothetical protein [Bacillus aquiflavi]UAC49087.1 hypothetical protein K6959_04090 [Bacillus aquiflavi]